MLIFDLQTFAEGGEPAAEPTSTVTSEPVTTEPSAPVTAEPTTDTTTTNQTTTSPEVDFAAIKLPDGWKMDDSFKSAVKDLGLSQEGAQKFVDYVKKDVVDSLESEQAAAREQLLTKWENDAHTEFNDEQLESAKLAYRNFADQELKDFMDKTGLGSYPPMIRLFSKIAQMTGEGRLVMGNATGSGTAAERLFSKSMES